MCLELLRELLLTLDHRIGCRSFAGPHKVRRRCLRRVDACFKFTDIGKVLVEGGCLPEEHFLDLPGTMARRKMALDGGNGPGAKPATCNSRGRKGPCRRSAVEGCRRPCAASGCGILTGVMQIGYPGLYFCVPSSGAMSKVDTRDDISIRTGFLAARNVIPFGFLMFCQFMESLWHSSIR